MGTIAAVIWLPHADCTSAPADPNENRQGSHPTGHGSRQAYKRLSETLLDTLLDALLELLGVVDVREWFPFWNRDPKELAKWLPALLGVEDEEALRRDCFLDFTVVLREDMQRMLAVSEAPGECPVPDDVVHDLEPLADGRNHQPEKPHHHLSSQRLVGAGAHPEDGAQAALVPAVRIADRENHLGVRVGRDQFSPEVRTRPIDNCAVAGQQWPPVDRLTGLLAPKGVLPEREPFGMLEVLQHVVAGTEPKAHQRLAQRQRAGAAKPGSDNRQRR
jgi:hypothetical protein